MKMYILPFKKVKTLKNDDIKIKKYNSCYFNSTLNYTFFSKMLIDFEISNIIL